MFKNLNEPEKCIKNWNRILKNVNKKKYTINHRKAVNEMKSFDKTIIDLISQCFNHQVHDVKLINRYRSGHCPIILQLKLNEFIYTR